MNKRQISKIADILSTALRKDKLIECFLTQYKALVEDFPETMSKALEILIQRTDKHRDGEKYRYFFSRLIIALSSGSNKQIIFWLWLGHMAPTYKPLRRLIKSLISLSNTEANTTVQDKATFFL